MRPRAEPCMPVVPASIPIAMPMPSSVRTSTCENLTGPARLRRSGTLPCMAEPPPPPPHRRRAHTRTRDLERYAGLFAERTGVMRSSAMRDLMAVTARPEVISLAGGLPDTSTFPPKSFAAQMTRIAQESVAEALQYGPTEGFEETVDCILQVMGAEGMLPDPEDVIVTTGGQQAIDLVCKTLVDPGDVVICEAPTYPGAVPVFCSYQADVVQVECDEDGMRIEELEAVLARLDAEGRRPKFVYSVPTFQNPAGVTMSLARRRRLVELARSREMLVVEDNPYGLLRFGGEPLPPLYQLDGGDFVIYIGTFSKILSPGIRLGWAVAPPPVMEKIVLGKQAADLCTSTLTQYFVREYFAEGRWREYVESLREIYRRRRDAMVAALRRALPRRGDLDRTGRRPLHLGDAARVHRHRRPAGAGAARRRRLRPRPGGLRRRARPQLDAAQLLRRRRGRDPRGRAPDRQGDRRAGRALRNADRRAPRGRAARMPAEAEARGAAARSRVRPSCPSARPPRAR